jgi:hypothetical protein
MIAPPCGPALARQTAENVAPLDEACTVTSMVIQRPPALRWKRTKGPAPMGVAPCWSGKTVALSATFLSNASTPLDVRARVSLATRVVSR